MNSKDGYPITFLVSLSLIAALPVISVLVTPVDDWCEYWSDEETAWDR